MDYDAKIKELTENAEKFKNYGKVPGKSKQSTAED